MTDRKVVLTRYADALEAYQRRDLRQAQYDEGAVIMADVLVNLHGEAHRDRRRIENRLFRRETFEHYEQKVFPGVVDDALRPWVAAGAAELVGVGHRIMLHLATLVAGVDWTPSDPEQSARLERHLHLFIEALTMQQSKLDRDARKQAVGQALADWAAEFFEPSRRRRVELLGRFAAGGTPESELPRDVLTTLLRYQGELDLSDDVLRRETAFFLLVASHTSATALVRVVHRALDWIADDPDRAERMRTDSFLMQRCVHETIRLNSSSPVGMRRALAPVTLRSGVHIPEGATVVIDLGSVNRDPAVYGPDADRFDPDRAVPRTASPYGLSFAAGMHVCIGQDLAAGVVPRSGATPDSHLFGLVACAAKRLFRLGVRRDPADPPTRDATTERLYWARYPVLLDA